MRTKSLFCLTVSAIMFLQAVAHAVRYYQPGIYSYVETDGTPAQPDDTNAIINPIFRGWATGVVSYKPAAEDLDLYWQDANQALGPATANDLVVSLGDLNSIRIAEGCEPGQITLSFNETIRDGAGYDFAVFENGFFYPDYPPMYNGGIGEIFGELAYVEVSSNGANFVRFPAVSLNPGPVGSFGTIETGNIHNLAGKHPNRWDWSINWVWCTGTPFDLNDIAGDPCVVSGIVDINNINYVRIVDIPGSGDFYDEALKCIDPNTGINYTRNHPIYDAWETWGSGGFDLDAVGVLQGQDCSADINLDGQVDMCDFALLRFAWRSHSGQANWLGRCDLAKTEDLVIDELDLGEFTKQWLCKESWRN